MSFGVSRSSISALWFLVALAPGVAACSSSGPDTASSARAASVAGLTADTTTGKALYEANCVSCHGTDGKSGTERRNVAGNAAANPAAAERQVLNGGDGMPSFSSLSDQEIADVVGYLETLD